MRSGAFGYGISLSLSRIYGVDYLSMRHLLYDGAYYSMVWCNSMEHVSTLLDSINISVQIGILAFTGKKSARTNQNVSHLLERKLCE